MLHGLLLDDYSELFIHRVQKTQSAQPELEDDDLDLGIGGVVGQQLQQIQVIVDPVKCEIVNAKIQLHGT